MIEVGGVSYEEEGLLVIGNNDGGPTVDRYESFDDAAPYLQRAAEPLTVVKAFEPQIVGGLIMREEVYVLQLASEGKTGEVMPHFDGCVDGVRVCTSPPAPMVDVIVQAQPRESRLLNAGVALVRVSPDAPGALLMNIKSNHGMVAAKVAETLRVAEERAREFIGGVLDSNPQPPYYRSAFPAKICPVFQARQKFRE
jgi:hypothetical protein